MKPKLFIGSSAESLAIAKLIAEAFSNEFDVKVWDSAFSAGEHFIERLHKELLLSDYALFVIAPDDKITKRGNESYTTRDNVIFELGMFIGALGLKKAYYIVTELIKGEEHFKITLPSDLDGLKKVRVTIEIDKDGKIAGTSSDAIRSAADTIKKEILTPQRIMPGLLPSTSLAIGYYRNFILQACKELVTQKKIETNDQVYIIDADNFDFNIIIPDGGHKASHGAYNKYVRNNQLQQTIIKTTSSPRGFPFFVSGQMKNGRMQLYDFPTTLLASRETISIAMPQNTSVDELDQLELKEITNFMRTLQYLLRAPESDDFRDNIHLLPASTLL